MVRRLLKRLLVVNAGSSSLKLSLIGPADETLVERSVEPGDSEALRSVIADGFADADVVGHRIVHGGERFRSAVVIDVIDRVEALGERAAELRQEMVDERLRHRAYTREVGDDSPDVRDWAWLGDS